MPRNFLNSVSSYSLFRLFRCTTVDIPSFPEQCAVKNSKESVIREPKCKVRRSFISLSLLNYLISNIHIGFFVLTRTNKEIKLYKGIFM